MKFRVYLFAAYCFLSSVVMADDTFFRAVANDDGRAVARLLQQGVDPNALDAGGQLPLALALRDESYAAAEQLLAHPGIRVDAANKAGETALMMAALRGNMDWVQRLLARGAAVHREGWTPLHYAASGPEPKVVALLLDRGAAIDALSPTGNTPLMMAARYGAIDAATLLLARGADPRPRNKAGLDAAEMALGAGRDRLAGQLQRAAR